ncbi:MAG: hypothetical protein WCX17_01635 [Parcubacteria group bacterium]|jgi:Tfp pilus assembly protein PilX
MTKYLNNKKIGNKKGSVLVFSMIMLSLILTSALAIGAAAVIERKNSLASNRSTQGFQVADSAVELAAYQLKKISGTNTLTDLGGLLGATSCSVASGAATISGNINGDAAKAYKLIFYDKTPALITSCSALAYTATRVKATGAYSNTSRAVDAPVCSDVWLGISPDGILDWNSIAVSDDGQYLVAISRAGGNYINYVSSNGGNTFPSSGTFSVASGAWNNIPIAMSGDGTYQTIANGGDGRLYVSSNKGNSFSPVASLGEQWSSADMSANGKYQTAVGNGWSAGSIYVSSNYGVSGSWNQKESPRNWSSVAVSRGDGTYQTAVVTGGYIYVSSDHGSSWTQKGLSKNWTSVAMSADGTYQTAVIGSWTSDNIYRSGDHGNSWQAVSSSPATEWLSVAMSDDGKYQTAASISYYGLLYKSSDYGVSWTQRNNIGGGQFSLSASSSAAIQAAVIGGSGMQINTNSCR